VERGDYKDLRADNSQAINRLEIAGVVEPGTILEISYGGIQPFKITRENDLDATTSIRM
jgi:hypothetical protein